MKITAIRTRVLRRRGKTVLPHFCTNPMDLLQLPESSMQTFTFSWLLAEIFTDDGHVGLGNAALSPRGRNISRWWTWKSGTNCFGTSLAVNPARRMVRSISMTTFRASA